MLKYLRFAAFACVLASAGAAIAGPVKMSPPTRPIPVGAAQWAPAGPGMQPGAFAPIVRSELARDVDPAWAISYDSMSFNLTSGAYRTTVYRDPAPPFDSLWGWGPGSPWYQAPFQSNDAIWNPASHRRFVERYSTLMFWNPNGSPAWGAPAGDPKRCIVLIRTIDAVGDDANGPGGSTGNLLGAVFLDYGVLNPGYYNLGGGAGIDRIPPGLLPVPNGPGEIQIAVGTLNDQNQFVQLPAPGNAQFGWMTQCSPTDTAFPGTNPSDSTGYMWYDDSTAPQGADVAANNVPNFTFEGAAAFTAPTGYSELTIWPDNLFGDSGRIQTTIMLAFDENAALANGSIVYSGIGDTANQPKAQTFTMVPVDGSGNPVTTLRRSMRVSVTASGEFTLIHPRFRTDPNDPMTEIQTYRVYVPKTASWLGKFNSEIVDFTSGSVTLSTPIELVNGNIETADNVVNLDDFLVLASCYETSTGDPTFVEAADITYDGTVNLDDFLVLAANYEVVGDDTP